MYLKLIHIFVLLILFAFPCKADAGDAASEARESANHALRKFLTSVPLQDLQNHGFETKEEVEKAVVGQGFEIFSVDPKDILDERPSKELQQLIVTSNMWMFIVAVEDKPMTLVTVGYVDGEWRLYQFGTTKLAKTLSEFVSAWPPSSGYHYKYVEIRQARTSFIQVFNGDKEIGIVPDLNLLGMIDGKKPKKYNPYELISPHKILPAVAPAVKSNIENWNKKHKKDP